MAESAPLLSLRSVSKSFGGVNAVRDITFDVRAGESVGLVGPNGAGKTTLFNCVCGQLRHDDGSIEFEGRSLRGIPTYKRARMGIGRTYQRAEVFADMTVRDHLLVAERARSRTGRLWKDLCNMSSPTAEEYDKVERIMTLVGLTELADTPVSALGLGNCRLVELARALAGEPTLLLADEPSSGLDERETADLAAVLRTIQRDRGTAVLLVEHDLGIVAEVVDRVVVMDVGAKIAEGTFAEVMDNQTVRHAYLGQSA
jgi:branched-chain amino acid transport system ATP-binding protein